MTSRRALAAALGVATSLLVAGHAAAAPAPGTPAAQTFELEVLSSPPTMVTGATHSCG